MVNGNPCITIPFFFLYNHQYPSPSYAHRSLARSVQTAPTRMSLRKESIRKDPVALYEQYTKFFQDPPDAANVWNEPFKRPDPGMYQLLLVTNSVAHIISSKSAHMHEHVVDVSPFSHSNQIEDIRLDPVDEKLKAGIVSERRFLGKGSAINILRAVRLLVHRIPNFSLARDKTQMPFTVGNHGGASGLSPQSSL